MGDFVVLILISRQTSINKESPTGIKRLLARHSQFGVVGKDGRIFNEFAIYELILENVPAGGELLVEAVNVDRPEGEDPKGALTHHVELDAVGVVVQRARFGVDLE